MPISIDGTGSITGLSAGGLPDASVVEADIAAGAVTGSKIATGTVTGDKIAAGAISAADLDGAQSGSAPIYGARAWVNFNGTGTVAIRASGNVSSITDNGVGYYVVNLSTALADANYCAVADAGDTSIAANASTNTWIAPTSNAVPVRIFTSTGSSYADYSYVSVAVFR